MRVIYTSKGMSKKFGVRVIYRKIRYMNSWTQPRRRLVCPSNNLSNTQIPWKWFTTRIETCCVRISRSLSPQHGASSGCGLSNSPKIWRIAAIVLYKQSRRPKMGGPPAWGLCEVLTTSHHKNLHYPIFLKASDMDDPMTWPQPQ